MNWPGFSAASNAWWLFLLIPLIIFYFLKLRRPRVEVSSLVLWQSVVNDQRVNSPFQKFKRNLLLWLQAAILLFLILGAMQPFIPAGAERADYLPILIDCSASMAATDAESGRSRLELAKERIRELVENLLPEQRVALIAMHSSAQRLTDFTSNRRILLEALNQLTVRDLPGQLDDALRMTQALARTVPISSVVIYSDGNFPQRVTFELPFKLNYQKLPPAGDNVGITAFNARQRTAPNWDIFLRVESSSATSGSVALFEGDRRTGTESFVLDAGQSQRLTFSVAAETTTKLEARLILDPGRFDSLGSDNVAFLELPPARPLRVFIDPELTEFRHALSQTEGIDLFPGDGTTDPRSITYDLLFSRQQADNRLESVVRMFVGITPPDLSGLLKTESGLTEIIDWERTSPLLQHMQLREVQITDDVRRVDDVSDGDVEELGYHILAYGRNAPLIVEKRNGAQLSHYLLFDTARSTLPYRVAFPILIHNEVQIALHEAAIADVRGSRTTVLPEVVVAPDSDFTIDNPDGTSSSAKSDATGVLNGVPALRVGRYEIRDNGNETVETIAVSLLDSTESSLKAADQIQFDELEVAATDELLETDRSLWSILAVLAFAALIVEWWLFQSPISAAAPQTVRDIQRRVRQ